VASPVLANLFMHYALDMWLMREFPAVAFERYADDAVIHCVAQYQARRVLAALHERMAQVGLELHPDKTRVVYCKDSNRRGCFEQVSFTFLGFTFQPREAVGNNGKRFTSFLPAVSKDALKKMSATVRSWRLHRWVNSTEADLARMINPVVRGWMAVDAHVIPRGCAHVIPQGVALGDVLLGHLLVCHSTRPGRLLGR
jgi:hypothetical protein